MFTTDISHPLDTETSLDVRSNQNEDFLDKNLEIGTVNLSDGHSKENLNDLGTLNENRSDVHSNDNLNPLDNINEDIPDVRSDKKQDHLDTRLKDIHCQEFSNQNWPDNHEEQQNLVEAPVEEINGPKDHSGPKVLSKAIINEVDDFKPISLNSDENDNNVTNVKSETIDLTCCEDQKQYNNLNEPSHRVECDDTDIANFATSLLVIKSESLIEKDIIKDETRHDILKTKTVPLKWKELESKNVDSLSTLHFENESAKVVNQEGLKSKFERKLGSLSDTTSGRITSLFRALQDE